MAQLLIDPFEIRKELVQFLRNSDILTIAERGVTTAQDTGTFTADTQYDISQPNIKNVRSVVVNSITLIYGQDYAVDFTFDNAGTTIARITFTSPQTGGFTIDYDHGTDKIWPDYPRDDLSINSYPRISADILTSDTDAFGVGGNEYITNIIISITVFSQDTEQIDNLIKSIRKAILENNTNFFSFKFIKPIGLGPLIEDSNKRQEIMRQNVDFLSMFNVETIS